MLRGRGSSTRGSRGGVTSLRGSSPSRGRGRGAPGSSSKSFPSAKVAKRRSSQSSKSERLSAKGHNDPFIASESTCRRSILKKHIGTSPTTSPSNPFDQERSENAAKREQSGRQNGILNGRGSRGASRDRFPNKSVRFASPLEDEQKQSIATASPPSTTANSFASPVFGTPAKSAPASKKPSNPFAAPLNPFGVSSATGTPQVANTGVFGSSFQPSPQSFNRFTPTQAPTGNQQTSAFGVPSGLGQAINHFESKPNDITISLPTAAPTNSTSSSSASIPNRRPNYKPNLISTPATLGPKNSFQRGVEVLPATPISAKQTKGNLGLQIDEKLRKNGIVAPTWPTSAPGDPRQKGVMEAFWQTTKAYRAKVRTYLMQNKLLDDPDQPKKLADAIDFKGTCEEMCPEFEKITRIVEHDVQTPEKELSPDGQTYWPSLNKMIKANARSAAGQDAPLPEDVRSPAALRRTLDYLIDVVLGANDLPKVHGFLWDRTRAVRRDFVFQAASMTLHELSDQVYCLELIARFHVIALHQMSREDVIAEDFSEQQEVEQLGKTLLSLVHAYEDCIVQGIACENEPEFRAYYVLFNSQDTGILEAVQDWGWRYWGESKDIRTAVNLVEALQNIWDMHGPLIPSTTEISQNAYHRYFAILLDTNVSYTMACFAEIHFNQVRQAALKTILASYRKQRDQTRDWTLDKLNTYLHFDDELDIIGFGEAYGLHFEDCDGQKCLLLTSDDSMSDPFPRLKQPHSYNVVERKRGNYSLLEVIHHTVYEETGVSHDGNELFVPLSPPLAVSNQTAQLNSSLLEAAPNSLDNSLVDDGSIPGHHTKRSSIEDVNKGNSGGSVHNQDKPTPVSWTQKQTETGQDYVSNNAVSPSQKAAGPSKSEVTGNLSTFDGKSGSPGGAPPPLLKQNTPAFPGGPPSTVSPSIPPTRYGPPKEQSSKLSLPAVTLPIPVTKPGSGFSSLKSTAFESLPKADPKILAITSEPLGQTIGSHVKNSKSQPLAGMGSNMTSSRSLSDSPSVVPSVSTRDQEILKPIPRTIWLPALANWVAAGKEGLINQFTEYTVEKILMQTVTKYVADEKKRRAQEEERISRESAAMFRYKFLATKYCRKWRELAHRMWLRRKGRFAREARHQMAKESFRISQIGENKDVVEEFRLSGGGKSLGESERQSLDQIQSTLSLRGLTRADSTASNDTSDILSSSQNSLRLKKLKDRKLSGHRRSQSQEALRKSLLSESAYLQGGSRIHLIPNYSPKMRGYGQPSGVKTDYFRLKARGIMTLPDGSPLANTAAVHLLHRTTSLDNVITATTPEEHVSIPSPMSLPVKAVLTDTIPLSTSPEHDDDIETLKARARAILKQDNMEKQITKKRLLDNDDEELFAKAKRIREQMDEGVEWFRAEAQKSLSRSSS